MQSQAVVQECAIARSIDEDFDGQMLIIHYDIIKYTAFGSNIEKQRFFNSLRIHIPAIKMKPVDQIADDLIRNNFLMNSVPKETIIRHLNNLKNRTHNYTYQLMGVDQLVLIIEGITKWQSEEAAEALLAIAYEKTNLNLIMVTPGILGKIIDAIEDYADPFLISPLMTVLMLLCRYEQYVQEIRNQDCMRKVYSHFEKQQQFYEQKETQMKQKQSGLKQENETQQHEYVLAADVFQRVCKSQNRLYWAMANALMCLAEVGENKFSFCKTDVYLTEQIGQVLSHQDVAILTVASYVRLLSVIVDVKQVQKSGLFEKLVKFISTAKGDLLSLIQNMQYLLTKMAMSPDFHAYLFEAEVLVVPLLQSWIDELTQQIIKFYQAKLKPQPSTFDLIKSGIQLKSDIKSEMYFKRLMEQTLVGSFTLLIKLFNNKHFAGLLTQKQFPFLVSLLELSPYSLDVYEISLKLFGNLSKNIQITKYLMALPLFQSYLNLKRDLSQSLVQTMLYEVEQFNSNVDTLQNQSQLEGGQLQAIAVSHQSLLKSQGKDVKAGECSIPAEVIVKSFDLCVNTLKNENFTLRIKLEALKLLTFIFQLPEQRYVRDAPTVDNFIGVIGENVKIVTQVPFLNLDLSQQRFITQLVLTLLRSMIQQRFRHFLSRSAELVQYLQRLLDQAMRSKIRPTEQTLPYYMRHGGQKFDLENFGNNEVQEVDERDEELGYILDIGADDGKQLLQICYSAVDYVLDVLREVEHRDVLQYAI